MKKSSILILIAICLFSCSKPSKEASITGEIKGLGTDTLYLYDNGRTFTKYEGNPVLTPSKLKEI